MIDILIGQYIRGSSPLHRMDARVKIILLIIYVSVLFMIKRPLSYALFTVYTAAIIMSSGIGLRAVMKSVKPLRWILIFTAVVNLFFTPGVAVASLWRVSVTAEGIELAVKMVVRLLCLITISSVLTLTTPPLRLTDAIETLLSPLEKLHVPAREMAMMMSIALRFIPVLAEEADRIIQAQTARGADFKSGGIAGKAKALMPVMIPLFVSAFRRAADLATAMDARCYISGAPRTRLHENRVTAIDIRAAVIFAIGAALIIVTEFVIEL